MKTGPKDRKKPKYQKLEIIDFDYDGTDCAFGGGSCKNGVALARRV